jgi:hypothetical protein
MLDDANLVATSWRGRGTLHYRNLVPLCEIYWIAKFERSRLRALCELKQGLEGR